MKRKILSLIFIISVLTIALLPSSANAAIGTCGDKLTWTLYDGRLTISGTGRMEGYSNYSEVAPWYSSRKNIKAVEISDGVTSIGSYAFQECSSLQSITIPDSVTSIGNDAFDECAKLTTVNYLGTLTEWKKISIGSYNTALTKSQLNTLMTVTFNTLGGNEIESQSVLSRSTASEPISPEKYGYSFGGWYTDSAYTNKFDFNTPVTEDLTLYAKWDLANGTCGSNLSWSLSPAGTFTLSGTGAMDSFSSILPPWHASLSDIKTVNISDGVTSIGDKAFSDCSNLEIVIMPKSVVSIGSSAFSSCSDLSTVIYHGTHTQWESIINGSDNAALTNADLHANALRYSQSTDGLIWSFGSDGTLTISGKGEMNDYSTTVAAPWAQYKNDIQSLVIKNGVTRIGNYAFYQHWSLKNITLAESITSVGVRAFENCPLESLYITDMAAYLNIDFEILYEDPNKADDYDLYTSCPMFYANKLYLDNKRITSVSVPETVEKIPPYAFNGCTGIRSVTLPDGLISIGKNAFASCGFSEILLPDSLSEIKDAAFANCSKLTTVSIPGSVISIGNGAFQSCTALTEIDFDSGIKAIGDGAFLNCPLLTEITVPNSVTSIGLGAFSECYNLQKLSLPFVGKERNITSGDNSYFGYIFTHLRENSYINQNISAYDEVSHNSKKYYIPKSLKELIFTDTTSVAEYAFENCTLESIAFTSPLNSIGHHAFFTCKALKKLPVISSSAVIGKSAFSYCESLTEVTINYDIPESMFQACKSLNTVTIGSQADIINKMAFLSCENLTTINLPISISEIWESAFSGCTALATINYEGSEDEFLSIYIEPGNEPFEAATVNYGVQVPQEISTVSTCINNKITVVPHNVEKGSYIVAACYNGKKLVQFFPCNYNGESELNFYPDVAFDTVKVMVWKSTASLSPLCDFEPVPVQ